MSLRTTHAMTIIGNVPMMANANMLPTVSVVALLLVSEGVVTALEDSGAAIGDGRSWNGFARESMARCASFLCFGNVNCTFAMIAKEYSNEIYTGIWKEVAQSSRQMATVRESVITPPFTASIASFM